jgi:hypothetical protein
VTRLWCICWAALAAASAVAAPPQLGPLDRAAPHPAVVRIVAPGRDSVSYGSGTLVDVSDRHGLVVTNWHVVNEATGPISVVFPDGFRSGASVQSVDRDWDLAALAIWKPPAAPVPLAQQPPRPGDRLTIAGYGSGQYRAASGRCTQYVAPGTRFPFEMVELAASARQGDSGGPIFNDRGELAGVLFGEGRGRTAGSYCGRVQWFLSSVTRRPAVGPSDPSTLLAARPAPPAATAPAAASAAESPAEGTASLSAPAAPPHDAPPAAAPPEPAAAPALVPPAESELAAAADPEDAELSWREVAGPTTADQVKTVLAAFGALAILLQVLGRLSASRSA